MRSALLVLTLSIASCAQTELPPSLTEPAPTPVAAAEEPALPSIDQGLADAQARMAAEITKYGESDVRFDGEPVDLTSPVTIDFEYGAGHGGNLVMLRMTIDGDAATWERLTWEEDRLSRPKTIEGTASRAFVPAATVRTLLDAVRALSTASVSRRPRDTLAMGSGNFFELVRVCRADARDDRTWQFAGYPSSNRAFRYAAIRFVLGRVHEEIDSLRWTDVPADEFRTTHFTDAFARNRSWYGEEFHWWVLERSLAALSWFGNGDALPTLAWLRDHWEEVGAGRALHARWISEAPENYLEGPPRDVWQK